MLVIPRVSREEPFVYDLEGERPALRPAGRGSVRIAVNQKGRGSLLQVGGKVYGSRRLADTSLERCDGYYHFSLLPFACARSRVAGWLHLCVARMTPFLSRRKRQSKGSRARAILRRARYASRGLLTNPV